MSLITSWANRGDPILTDKSVEQRTYRVGTPDDFIDYREIIGKETMQWVGFTEAAASQQIDANAQPSSNTNETYSWSMNEDSRTIGSYTIERQYEKKTTSVVGSTPAPVIPAPTFSLGNTNNTTFPQTLTISTTVTGAKIRYRLDSYSGDNKVVGTWQETTNTSATFTLNTTNIAGGAVIGGFAMHKYITVEAEVTKTLQTGTYTSGFFSRNYGWRAPVLSETAMNVRGFGGRLPTNIGNFLDADVSVTFSPIVITKMNGGTLAIRDGFALSNTKNPLTANKFSVDWSEWSGLPDSIISQDQHVINYLSRFSGSAYHRYAIFTGSSRNNSGYRSIARVIAVETVTVEGFVYYKETDRIFYFENDPF